MALVAITPVAASVDWDAQGTRPTRIRFGDREVVINRVATVRDERAAFPAASGPNLRVVVEADSGDTLELIFDVRRKRWFVDALDAAARPSFWRNPSPGGSRAPLPRTCRASSWIALQSAPHEQPLLRRTQRP
jgi:hypothetical protein